MAGTRAWAASALASGAILLMAGASASAAESCYGYKKLCEAACTPARIARFYSDNPDRCSASCSPRFYQCVSTGLWVHLEDSRPGLREPVDPF